MTRMEANTLGPPRRYTYRMTGKSCMVLKSVDSRATIAAMSVLWFLGSEAGPISLMLSR